MGVAQKGQALFNQIYIKKPPDPMNPLEFTIKLSYNGTQNNGMKRIKLIFFMVRRRMYMITGSIVTLMIMLIMKSVISIC